MRCVPRRDWTLEGPGVALRDVLLVERVDGDGVGQGGRGTTGGGRGTTGAGGAFEGPRSMAAAILSKLEEMRPRGRSNIAIRSRRASILCRIPDSSRSSMSNPVCWSCRNGWSSGLAMLPRRVVGLDLGGCAVPSSDGPCARLARPGSSCEAALYCFYLLCGCVTFISCK